MNEPDNKFEGLDLAGLGKVAKAIPAEVYTQGTETLTTSFKKLVAPFTETTDGFGRYLRQKFDNMVEIEKALTVYSIERACYKAEKKIKGKLGTIQGIHPKTFVRTLEEASKETDPTLHEMWTSLLATQLTGQSHPHFVALLAHFSPEDAQTFLKLRTKSGAGIFSNRILLNKEGDGKWWQTHVEDKSPKLWTLSCQILVSFELAAARSNAGTGFPSADVLYRTKMGDAFMDAIETGREPDK